MIGMRELSRVIAKMWREEPISVKNHWDQVAERENLKSSYRTSFDVIPGLDIINTGTFVNASSESTIPKNSESGTEPAKPM